MTRVACWVAMSTSHKDIEVLLPGLTDCHEKLTDEPSASDDPIPEVKEIVLDPTDTVVDAICVLPLTSWHVRSNSALLFIYGVSTAPLVLVLDALFAVKSLSCGLETIHEDMPEVTHPIVDCAFGFTVLGFATNTIFGVITFTLH